MFPTSGRLWFASRNFFSLSNQLCERGILILFCHLELLLMGVLRANCCSWCCDCRGCRDLWIHAWGEFRTCFLSLLLDQLLLYLCEYNIKWRFLIIELVRIFPLPIKLFGREHVSESFHVHPIVQVECLNLHEIDYLKELRTFLKSWSVKLSKIKSKSSIYMRFF